MPGDYSRFTDDPKKRFSQVLMQQGRVLLDSDWNELVEIITRRDRLHIFDIMGRAAVPRVFAANSTAFAITSAGAPANDLKIGAGRAYVDGIMVEAMPTHPLKTGNDPLTYLTQPFFPSPPALNTVPGGSGLAYLDVWEREITALEDPSLLDPALGGVDTTTRIKTIWQVKIKDGANCASDLNALFPPSAGQLEVKVDAPPDPPDPCLLPESGGLRDIENRFYRVEIHGNSSPAKFKFSRDPIATRIVAINPPSGGKTTIKVERIGLDSVLRFSPGDWVEVTSDFRVLRGEPGVMANIEFIDEAAREIRLDRVVPVTETSVAFPARLIRWDQRASAGVTLDGNGLITVTGAFQALELGIQVRLTLVPAGGSFHHGDTWRFPTRVATGAAGPMIDPRPSNITHHYMALATVSNLGSPTPTIGSDCRNLWPPDVTGGRGEDCSCTVCVSPEEHNSGSKTIQQAIFEAKAKGGGHVCLKPGTYDVRETIVISEAAGLTLTGHGAALIAYQGDRGPAILIEASVDTTIDDLLLVYRESPQGEDADVGIEIRNCLLDTTVQDCTIWLLARDAARTHGIAIGLTGIVMGVHLVRNILIAGTGIGNAQSRKNFILGIGLDIHENTMICGKRGIAIIGIGLAMDVKQNAIVAEEFGIILLGLSMPGGAVTLADNNLLTKNAGIGVTTTATTIANNSITSTDPPLPTGDQQPSPEANGILVDAMTKALAPEQVKIFGNRVALYRGAGIRVSAAGSAMVKQNSVFFIGGGGIVSGSDKDAVGRISIENNDIVGVGLTPNPPALEAAGIHLSNTDDAMVSDNKIAGVMPFKQNHPAYGIHVEAPKRLQIFGNSISVVRPSTGNLISAGIEVTGSYGTAEITNNDIVWRADADPNGALGIWQALRIAPGISTWNPLVMPIPFDATGGGDFSKLFSKIFLVFAGARAFELKSREQALLVRGNIMQAVGSTTMSLAEINANGSSTFGENDCRIVRVGPNDQRPMIGVIIVTETTVVSSNHVLGPVELAMDIRTTGDAWSILGNLTDRKIQVNGGGLTGTWIEVNRLV